MRGTDLTGANSNAAILRWANLSQANLQDCQLPLANLDGAKARKADFRNADLGSASIVGVDFSGADLSGCFVYGISAWNVNLHKTKQNGLVITRATEPLVTVDDLQVAQFIYLFERPASRDFTETVVTLAHMARFILADLTDPASLPKELEAIVPRLAVPMLPLLAGKSTPYAMFGNYWKYDWVLEIRHYTRIKDLLGSFQSRIIVPAERKAKELTARRAAALNHR